MKIEHKDYSRFFNHDKKYNDDDIIYQLTVQDIKTVAEQEFDHEFTGEEIEKIIEKIEPKKFIGNELLPETAHKMFY
ncbi:MAG: hypothetical protein K9J16_11725 [Melioribacteraceae bacterium]|nr:hypothetical protein [Melioribacteraceae bacterium]MCF8354570.1 hypothetical protein [Melioribacteraceae bacterium]MCF8420088.1 hypothetical protein [Melioribacteraceae bacterium]